MTQRYDTYKDSGVQWLGEIPGHWEMRKMKYIFDERSEKNHPNEPMLSATQSEGVILQSKYQGMVVVVNTGFEGLKLVKDGDFVIHLRSFQGGIEYAYDRGIISSAYTILNPKYPEYSAYYKRLFKSISFIDLLKICVTGIREGQNINYSKLKQFFIPLPPLSEQHSIVSFLDAKCGKIDEWVTKKQKEVEHLQELKQRVIADAVTRGLNPHVKMKATNIPWLKEIPGHWDCIRLTTCILSSVVGSWGVDEKKDGTDILCLRVADFDYNKGIIKEDKLTYRNYEGKLSEEKFFRDGDLLLEKSGGGDIYPVGRVVRFSLNGRIATCSNFIQKLTPNSEIVSSDYLYFWFKMIYSLKINGMYFNQTTGIQNLKVNEYLKQKIYLPPLSEQKQIVSYLDAKTSKIDKLIANITKEIDCIKEYKQRLISDVVTGQIKVC